MQMALYVIDHKLGVPFKPTWAKQINTCIRQTHVDIVQRRATNKSYVPLEFFCVNISKIFQ
jgi:hypothetical protein